MALISNLPLYLLSLPIALLALSVHETAHGYVAYKLGDPTARSLGRLTLNPLKHFDLVGLLFMTVLKVGWAKPVPINTRFFKKPKRDMALTAAAGPASNLILALFFGLLLRLELLFVEVFMQEDLLILQLATSGAAVAVSAVAKMLSVLAHILFMGVLLNISLVIFNMIPLPPFDGSRITHVFLPTKWYFAIMKYERIIMIVLLVLFWTLPMTWLSVGTEWISTGILWLTGIRNGTATVGVLNTLLGYVSATLPL